MFEVDRIAAIIRPTERMLNWLKKQPGALDSISTEDIKKDCTVLLIPRFDGPSQAKAYIREISRTLFEAELASWGIPESDWPTDRGFATFSQWFNVEFHSLIFDMLQVKEYSEAV